MEVLGLSGRPLAEGLGVPHNRISAVLLDEPAITTDTALRLAAYFSISAEVCLSLQ